MRYTADIMAGYEDLFKEAHEALVKEAGVLDRLGRGLATLVGRGRGAAKATTEALTPGLEGAAIGKTYLAPAEAAAALREAGGAAPTAAASRAAAPSPSVMVAPELAEAAGASVPAAATSAATPAATAEATRRGLHPALAAALGLGGGAAGTYGAMQAFGPNAEEIENARKRTRNIAFGSGLAAGIVAPHLIQGLGTIARGMGGSGLFPAFQQQQGVY